MDAPKQNEPLGKSNVWLTVIVPLIVGGLTTPFIPNLAVWIFAKIHPGFVGADFWEQVGIYVALVRFIGLALLATGIYVAVREVRRVKTPAPNSDATSESN